MTIVIFRETYNSVNVGRQLSAWTCQRAESWWKIKAFQFGCIIAAIAVVAIIAFTATRQALFEETLSALPPNPVVEVERRAELPISPDLSDTTDALPQREPLLLPQEKAIDTAEKDQARLEQEDSSLRIFQRCNAGKTRPLISRLLCLCRASPRRKAGGYCFKISLKDIAVGTPLELHRRPEPEYH